MPPGWNKPRSLQEDVQTKVSIYPESMTARDDQCDHFRLRIDLSELYEKSEYAGTV